VKKPKKMDYANNARKDIIWAKHPIIATIVLILIVNHVLIINAFNAILIILWITLQTAAFHVQWKN